MNIQMTFLPIEIEHCVANRMLLNINSEHFLQPKHKYFCLSETQVLIGRQTDVFNILHGIRFREAVYWFSGHLDMARNIYLC